MSASRCWSRGCAGLFANRGLTVRPFKPQNMSNNAAVTIDGGEIGRAQALQAIACRTPADRRHEPGAAEAAERCRRPVDRARPDGRDLEGGAIRTARWPARRGGRELPHRLEAESDLVIVEGAGSPAEINLRAGDIANMGFARAANVPVVLVGDIDRGHVIAALVGAHVVLDEADRAMIRGFLINKFRGDPALFHDGRAEIVRRTGWPDCGMAPWLAAARRLPAEDAVVLDRPSAQGRKVRRSSRRCCRGSPISTSSTHCVPSQRSISPSYRREPAAWRRRPVILPGTKATLADLAFLRAQGWDIDLAAHVRRGGRVLGVCGGYQMLGRRLADPDGIEGAPDAIEGLGLLTVETVMTGDKTLRPVAGRLPAAAVRRLRDACRPHDRRATPMLTFDDGVTRRRDLRRRTGARLLRPRPVRPGEARAALLAELGAAAEAVDQATRVDQALDDIAAGLEQAFDIPALAAIAGLETSDDPPDRHTRSTYEQRPMLRALIDGKAKPLGALGRSRISPSIGLDRRRRAADLSTAPCCWSSPVITA
jgi:adenosylcobyric acid synthase